MCVFLEREGCSRFLVVDLLVALVECHRSHGGYQPCARGQQATRASTHIGEDQEDGSMAIFEKGPLSRGSS